MIGKFESSESVKAVAAALLAVQKAMQPVKKEAENQHLRSRYATLDACMEEVMPRLGEAGLLLLQGESRDDDAGAMAVTTTVMHVESGEWLAHTIRFVIPNRAPQSVGSALTDPSGGIGTEPPGPAFGICTSLSPGIVGASARGRVG